VVLHRRLSAHDARLTEPNKDYARSQVQQADSVSGPLETTEMPGNLIYYALVLIVIALVAALLGFGGVAGTAMSGAHLLLWVAVVIVILGVVFALIRRA
jgi:uncharacterized membrane protein YtjA (UPF0391 family)